MNYTKFGAFSHISYHAISYFSDQSKMFYIVSPVCDRFTTSSTFGQDSVCNMKKKTDQFNYFANFAHLTIHISSIKTLQDFTTPLKSNHGAFLHLWCRKSIKITMIAKTTISRITISQKNMKIRHTFITISQKHKNRPPV